MLVRGGLLALALLGLGYWAWSRRPHAPAAPTYEGRTLPQWIADVKTPDLAVQRRAAAVLIRIGAPAATALVDELIGEAKNHIALILVRMGKEATPALLDGLKNESVCRESARILGLIGSRAAAASPALMAIVNDANAPAGLRAEAAGALGRIGTPAEEIVPVLRAALHDKAAMVRLRAAESMSWIGPTAVAAAPALIATLKDEKEEVAAAACLALAHLGAVEAVPALFQAFAAGRDEVARKAGHALWQMGENAAGIVPQLRKRTKGTSSDALRARSLLLLFGPLAVPGLIDGLRESDAELRRTAAEVLGAIGPPTREFPQVVPSLIAALKDQSPLVKLAAAVALAQIDATRATEAVPILAASLDVPGAAEALGEIGRAARSAVPALISALRKRKGDEDDEARRSSASRALARIGPPALPALLDALKDSRDGVAPLAAEALGWMIPSPNEAASALRQAIRRDRAHAGAYALALGKLAPPPREAVPELTALLPDAAVRPQAAAALVRIDPAQAAKVLPLLLDDLKSKDENRRQGAVTALGLMGPEAALALPELLKRFNDEQLSQSIEIALIGIGEKAAIGIADLLDDFSPPLRQRALDTLLQMGSAARPARFAAVKRLADSVPEVRVRAAMVLEAIGTETESAVAPLIANLTPPQEPVRQASASALGHLGSVAKAARASLVECLLDPDPVVRYYAALALGGIEPADADIESALRAALDDPSPQVRIGAVDSLMRRNRKWAAEAEPILLTLSRPLHDLDTRIRAAEGLLTIAPEKAKPSLPLLHSELNGPSPAIRLRAASLLMRLEPGQTPHLVLGLITALRMADPAVRGSIAQALGKLGGKARAAIPILQRLVQFDLPSVRKEAAKALRAIDAAAAKRIGIE